MASLRPWLAVWLILLPLSGCGGGSGGGERGAPEPGENDTAAPAPDPRRAPVGAEVGLPTRAAEVLGGPAPAGSGGPFEATAADPPGVDPEDHPQGPPMARSLSPDEAALVGVHTFGVQFIWDHYGTATISQGADGDLWIDGEQRDGEDFVTVTGRVRPVDAKTIEIEGVIDTRIARCCGRRRQQSTFRLRRSGRRPYWRLQEPHRNRFCDKYTCFYYIDLFVGGPAKSAPAASP